MNGMRSTPHQGDAMTRNEALKVAIESLAYDKETGNLTWTKPIGFKKSVIGQIAGSVDSRGYRSVYLKGFNFRAHLLCWILAYGVKPTKEIDHINGIKDDNRLNNLREATRSENCINRKLFSNNKSGFKGVHWREHAQRFTANIYKNKKRISLGYFDTAEKAHDAYLKAAHEIHGEFAKN